MSARSADGGGQTEQVPLPQPKQRARDARTAKKFSMKNYARVVLNTSIKCGNTKKK